MKAYRELPSPGALPWVGDDNCGSISCYFASPRVIGAKLAQKRVNFLAGNP